MFPIPIISWFYCGFIFVLHRRLIGFFHVSWISWVYVSIFEDCRVMLWSIFQRYWCGNCHKISISRNYFDLKLSYRLNDESTWTWTIWEGYDFPSSLFRQTFEFYHRLSYGFLDLLVLFWKYLLLYFYLIFLELALFLLLLFCMGVQKGSFLMH